MSVAEKEIKSMDESTIKLAVLENTAGTISENLKRFEKRFDNIDKRHDFIESKFDKKFEQIDNRFTYVEQKIDKKFEDLNKELIYLHKENQNQFRWIMGVILGLYGIIITFIGKGVFVH